MEANAAVKGGTMTVRVKKADGSRGRTLQVRWGSHRPWWARLLRRESVERVLKGDS